MAHPPISLVVITFNESKNIERCLQSVPWAEDIVVLDSGSEDDTVAKASALGARVFVEAFRGYREQKERATQLAKFDWILSLDADEALSPELQEELKRLLNSEAFAKENSEIDGFEMPRLSFHLGRWIRHGGWHPDWQLRLFHRQRCHWVGGQIHEKLAGKKIRRLKKSIYHWVFENLEDQVSTNNEYSSRGAMDLLDKGVRFGYLKLFLKPVSKFVETYLWKLGFLDGAPGLFISVGAAYSVFLKYAKLWELQRRNGR